MANLGQGTVQKIILLWTKEQMLAYERRNPGTTRGQKRQRKTKARYCDNVKDWTRQNSTEIFTTIEKREEWKEINHNGHRNLQPPLLVS
ncbi:hypothetical protein PoB_000488600 [Plakobranchus ocellatus]|uniref:Uncharacterized protein n=1 Tax=Plakobranchus ocellatus TaxID=259542 RepID=A0AAV3XT13_9GAST|nr:hypothetical protein PoB_000488600 [Plakobranchus ocellatus]